MRNIMFGSAMLGISLTFYCLLLNSHVFVFGYYRVITKIFDVIDLHISNKTLISELQMKALRDLYDLFVKLIEYLVLMLIFFSLQLCLAL